MSDSPHPSLSAIAAPLAASRHGVPISPEAVELWREIERLDLVAHIAELEVLGWTVIPSEKAAPAGFCDRLREKILEVAERRGGVAPDMISGRTHADAKRSIGGLYTYMLFEDHIFQQAMCNPIGMALTTYMVGKNAVASNCIAVLKGPGNEDLGLHADNTLMTAPFPPNTQVCNITYALTDYTRENGALCVVPGSHKHFRHPVGDEGLTERVPVECEAGSIIFWGGSLWHGAFTRTAPGLRINLIMAMFRPHIRPQEPYRENVTREILEANPPRFARLMGQHLNYGWKQEGPQNEATAYNVSRHAFD
jgi:ectoine hydroxylase-related dioxygenase (phytanoyl-CoA dioxygenase family)